MEQIVTFDLYSWYGTGFTVEVWALLVQCFIQLQITDFSQRKSDRSSYEVDELPVTEQEVQKLKNPDTEQELEVSFKYCKFISLSLICLEFCSVVFSVLDLFSLWPCEF